MKKSLLRFPILFCCFIICSITTFSQTSWRGTFSTSWTTAGNWTSGVPTASTAAIIGNASFTGLFQPRVSTTATCLSLNIGTTKAANLTVYGTLTIATNLVILPGSSATVDDGIIRIGALITNTGTLNVLNGTAEFYGILPQIIPDNTFANNTIKNLIISNDVTLLGEDTLTGVLSFGNVNSKTFSTGGYLTLRSSASGTARVADITNAGANSGNSFNNTAKVERFIPGNRAWRLLTSPVNASGASTIHDAWQEGVNNTTLNYASNNNPVPGYGVHITKGNAFAQGFDVGINNNPSIKVYNNSAGTWDALSSTLIPITDYPAYMIFVRGNRSTNLSQGVNAAETDAILQSEGALKTGDQSFTVAATGFTVIGNPSASAIDFDQIAKTNSTNIQDNFYLWDPKIGGSNQVGGFVNFIWNPIDLIYDQTPFTGDGISQYIQSGAAFLARSANGTSAGTLVIKETDKTAAGSDNVNRPAGGSSSEKLVTNLYSVNTDGTISLVDGLLNSYATGYSNTIDNNDAAKLGNFAENLSTLREGQRLTVERRQLIGQTDTIFFNMTQMKLKQYTFDFLASNLDHPGLSAFLEDNYLGTSTPIDLNATTSASFTVTNEAGAWAADRFRIVFRPSSPLPVTLNSVKAWQLSDAIQVEWKVENETGIKQYEIERSADGLGFTKSVTVTTTISNHGVYNWLDANAKEGNNYYRIKTIDVNGAVHYSSVIKVYMGKGGEQIVLDTKVITNGALSFKLINMPAGKYGVRLLNNIGQVISSKQIAHTQGSSTETLNLNTHLAKGIYMLEFTKTDNKTMTEKVIVE